MKGNKKVIDALNDVLGMELMAINQYFLHARMLQNWGLSKIGHLEYKASIDEMKHADELVQRILFLEGLPNLQKLGKLKIGTDVKEVLNCDLKLELEAIPILKSHIQLCESEKDFVSRELLVSILNSEEHHVDWIETQLGLIERTGVQNYILGQIEMKESSES